MRDLRERRERRRRAAHPTPEDILAPLDAAIAALAQRLRDVVRRTMPEAEERAYRVWKGIGYVHPQAGYVCGIFPTRDSVSLAFELGVLLEDPERLLRPGRTSDKKVRYVEVRAPKDIRVRSIRQLLRQAVALRCRRG